MKFIHNRVCDIYIVNGINLWSYIQYVDFENVLFDAVKLLKNTDPDKYVYILGMVFDLMQVEILRW